jgi:hypothetical protein
MIDVQDSFASRFGHDEERFNFDFQLQKARYVLDQHSTDRSQPQYGDLLPCSIALFGPWCQHAVGQACCQAEVVVKYEIEARAYNGDECVASQSQQVRIFDCPDTHPPPMHLEHFPGEHTCSDRQRLKSAYKLSKPVLTISSAEPRPVEIRTNGEVAMAGLSFVFTLRDVEEPPKDLDVSINSILKATTFIATRQMDSQPTVAQSKTNPFIAAVPKWGRPYHRKLHVNHWTPGNDPRTFTARAMIWMPISEGATPSPTFFSPYLARRYSAGIRVEVKGAGKAVFQLHVPVQVVYKEPEAEVPSYETAMSTPVSEVEGFTFEDVDELPIYVR